MVGADEAGRKTVGGSKVTWRVEWKSSGRRTTVAIVSVDYTTDFEISPSRGVASGASSGGVGLKEVCLVERCDVHNAGEEDEECE